MFEVPVFVDELIHFAGFIGVIVTWKAVVAGIENEGRYKEEKAQPEKTFAGCSGRLAKGQHLEKYLACVTSYRQLNEAIAPRISKK
jgi:hypothetical protein